ncbi:hypothetical protein BB560_002805 [Smittium megazygosporum]|uniref:Phospholipase n=1 Tax=Smittium megazygosporum TaxID=133381 RepID=A0A2T9ZDS2_9FUNG|nr:hypothetical protein BB560_002805 [Smittium megazygosporum]
MGADPSPISDYVLNAETPQQFNIIIESTSPISKPELAKKKIRFAEPSRLSSSRLSLPKTPTRAFSTASGAEIKRSASAIKLDIHKKFNRALSKTRAAIRLNGAARKKQNDYFGVFGVDGFLDKTLTVPFLYHFFRVQDPPLPYILPFSINCELQMRDLHPQQDKIFPNIEIVLKVKYGDIEWSLIKKLVDFIALNATLTIMRLRGKAPTLPKFPNNLLFVLGKNLVSRKHSSDESSQAFVRSKTMFLDALEHYISEVLITFATRPFEDICTFFQMSSMSILPHLSWKGNEGYLYTRIENIGEFTISRFKRRSWKKRWVVVRDTYIAICDSPGSLYPRRVLLFNRHTTYKQNVHRSSSILSSTSSTFTCPLFDLKMKSDNEKVAESIQTSLTLSMKKNEWVQPHRFGSFAPERSHTKSNFFIDGISYFESLYSAISEAKETIYIMGWWISPEIYLKRPPRLYPDSRLDILLKKKAKSGVMVYILVYKEVKLSLTIDSAYSKRKLTSLHKNIIVQRHPDHAPGGTTFWAHHEKVVVVDNMHAFVGGIDLCFGRWDSHEHRGADSVLYLDENKLSQIPKPLLRFKVDHNSFLGQDYSNPRVKDFLNVKQFDMSLVNRQVTSRMPWHDIHMEVFGKTARDISRHFIERWNFIKRSKSKHRKTVPLLMPQDEQHYIHNEKMVTNKNAITCLSQVLRSSCDWSSGVKKERSIHDAYCDLIINANHFIYIENQFFISSISDGAQRVKNKISECLVERIVRAHKERTKFKVIVIIPLMPAFEGDVASGNAATLKNVMFWQFKTISRGRASMRSRLSSYGIQMDDYIRFYSLRMYDLIFASPEESNFITLSPPNVPLEPESIVATPPKISLESDSIKVTSEKASDKQDSSEPTLKNDTRETESSEDIFLKVYQEPEVLEFKKKSHSSGNLVHFELESNESLPSYQNDTRTSFVGKPPPRGKRYPDSESIDTPLNSLKDKPNADIRPSSKSKSASKNKNLRFKIGKSHTPKNDTKRASTLSVPNSNAPTSESPSHKFPRNFSIIKNTPNFKIDMNQARDRFKSFKQSSVTQASNIWGGKRISVVSNRGKTDDDFVQYFETDEFKRLYADDARSMSSDEPGPNNYSKKHSKSSSDMKLKKSESASSLERQNKQGSNNIFYFGEELAGRAPDEIKEEERVEIESASPGLPSVTFFSKGTTTDTPEFHLVSEQVYVHCKLMIVDDRKTIIGSANINDRSMQGNRDSEIAVLIEDREMVDMKMDGRSYKGGKFSHSLRMDLLKQHVGISSEVRKSKLGTEWLIDPLSDEFCQKWVDIADKNTSTFRDIFKCTPDDNIHSLSDYKKFAFPSNLKVPYGQSKAKTVDEILSELSILEEVNGNLVFFPLDFLKDENLEPKFGDKENLVPYEVFV